MYAVQPNLSSTFGAGDAALPAAAPIVAGQTAFLNGSTAAASDGVSPNPWPGPNAPGGAASGGANSGGTSGGGFFGVMQNLMSQLSALLAQLGGGNAGASSPTQNVAAATFASTGDPHLSETGTLNSGGGTTAVNTHFDSMSSHSDLLSSADVAGGYRLSTTVTNPNAKGVTYNQSATVHLNGDRDSVTLNNDGSCAVVSDGTTLTLGDGQTLALSGGAEVTRNTDGSLIIDAQNGSGGSIDTALTKAGSGVDVKAMANNVTVGGDIPLQQQTAS